MVAPAHNPSSSSRFAAQVIPTPIASLIQSERARLAARALMPPQDVAERRASRGEPRPEDERAIERDLGASPRRISDRRLKNRSVGTFGANTEGGLREKSGPP